MLSLCPCAPSCASRSLLLRCAPTGIPAIRKGSKLRPLPLTMKDKISCPVRVPACASSAADGFFSGAFKSALAEAIERSDKPEEAEAILGSPDITALAEKQGTECLIASAQQDMLSAALEASRTTLNRLYAIQGEVARAIEREKLQVERLQFSVDKAMKDEAYYRSLRRMLDERSEDP